MGYRRCLDVVQVHEGLNLPCVVGGLPTIPGDSIYEQMKWLEKNDDQIRRLVLREPRGMPSVCGNIILPAKDPRASIGFIVMEQTEYPMIAGANTIAVATVALETGMVPMTGEITEFDMECPAGLIHIIAECDLKRRKVTQASFQNVPVFPVLTDQLIDTPEFGKVKVDFCWGGMFYAVIDATQFGLELVPENGKEIARISAQVVACAQRQVTLSHPDYPGVGLTISIMHQPPVTPGTSVRSCNVIMTGELDPEDPKTWTGALDRGVCGTGTCSMLALRYSRGELGLNEEFVNEGLMGVQFRAKAIKETEIHGHKAIIPQVGGECWISAYSKYVLEEDDPFPEGFTIGDIW